jgi:hypothetical protein
VAAFVIGDDFKFADEAGYVDTARRLSSGGGFGIPMMPPRWTPG